MWSYNYNNELYHYGVKGMRWGHRKKYLTASGQLNKLGKARKAYEEAKNAEDAAYKDISKKVSWKDSSIDAVKKRNSLNKKYEQASINTTMALAKYNAAKAKNSKKAEKQEFKTYYKTMARLGVPGSDMHDSDVGESVKLYDRIKKEKGKQYADKVLQSARKK